MGYGQGRDSSVKGVKVRFMVMVLASGDTKF